MRVNRFGWIPARFAALFCRRPCVAEAADVYLVSNRLRVWGPYEHRSAGIILMVDINVCYLWSMLICLRLHERAAKQNGQEKKDPPAKRSNVNGS